MTTRPAPRAVLVATLVDALLAGPWRAPAMLGRLRASVDPVETWAGDLVAAALAAYPTPPTDRPREFAVFVDLELPSELSRPGPPGSRRERESAPASQDPDDQDPDDQDPDDQDADGRDPAEGGEPPLRAEPRRAPLLFGPVVLRRFTSSTAMGPRRWPVPVVDDLAALASRLDLTLGELLWFADTRGFQRRDPRSALRHYRYAWVERPGRVPRLLEAPRPRLKMIQRRVLDGLLAPLPVHPGAHGFVAGRSALTGARVHEGSAVVLTMDLESFFAAVTAGRVHGVLRSAGYPEPVAHLLAGLCTLRTPVDVLRRIPPGPAGVAAAAWRLGRRLDVPHLPQGSPTSPAMANLVAFTLDRRLHHYAARAGWRYTRYADDLTFSSVAGPGSGGSTGDARRLAVAVTRIAASAGFTVHPGKTRIRTASQRQTVTGLVVNESAAVPREDYDRLRAVLHACVVHGPAGQGAGHPRFREHLMGRIAQVGASHPRRGERLREAFARVAWPDGS